MKKYIFLAGIIQGSSPDDGVHDQGYRQRIRAALEKSFPRLTVYCPVENHPDSIAYTDQKAREVFFFHIDMVRKAAAVVVFLPEASMGSAIEMWEAHAGHVPVISVTPMKTNWVVRLLSDVVCESIDKFEELVESGKLKDLIQAGD